VLEPFFDPLFAFFSASKAAFHFLAFENLKIVA
jgi:hypothetical protein